MRPVEVTDRRPMKALQSLLMGEIPAQKPVAQLDECIAPVQGHTSLQAG
jgi:hypothetical protein